METRSKHDRIIQWVMDHPDVKVELTWHEPEQAYEVFMSKTSHRISMEVEAQVLESIPEIVLDEFLNRLTIGISMTAPDRR